MKLFLFVFVLTSINCRLISHEAPIVLPSKVIHQNVSYDVFVGAAFQYPFSQVKSCFGHKMYERTLWNKSETLAEKEIDSKPQLYIQSKECDFSGSQINFDKVISLYNASSQIKASYRESNIVYVIVDQNLTVSELRMVDSQKKLVDIFNEKMNSQFIIAKSTFFTLKNTVYLTDGYNLYHIDYKAYSNKATLVKVNGFVGLDIMDEMLKIDNEDKTDSVIILSNTHLYLYKFSSSSECKASKYSLDFEDQAFVDIIYNGSSIYLLDLSKGLYIMQDHIDAVPEQIELGINQNLKFTKMELYKDTIEIIFQFAREIYVVEIILDEGEFYINRYYDQVDGFKDINFIDQYAFFIGEDEILLVQHSIPQNVLLSMPKLQKSYFRDYGMQQFDVIEELSNSSTLVLFGYSDYQLIIVYFNIQAPLLQCDFKNTNSSSKIYFLKTNSTNCPHTSTGKYCQHSQFVIINIVEPVTHKTNVMIIVLSVLVVGMVFMLAICILSKFRNKRKAIMDAITKKIEELKASATSQKLKL